MMELHCWGNANGYHRFHPESVATIWYLLLSGLEFQIVPSSNDFVANLPFLRIEDGEIISGYENIIIYLKDKFDLDNGFNDEEKLIIMGLNSLINDKFNCITQYTFFLNKENYENYSRGLFKQLLPFPMQYAPPLEFKNRAIQLCSQLGLNLDNGLVIREGDNRYNEILETEKRLENTPALGTLHSSQKKFQLNKLLLEKSTVNNMRAIDLFDNYISQIVELRKEINTTDKPFILGDTISTADLLFYAHLTAQTLPDLPNQFMKFAIQYKNPQLWQNLNDFIIDMEKRLTTVQVDQTSGDYYPSLVNYLKFQIKTFI